MDSKKFALMTMVGLSPWIGEIDDCDYADWCSGAKHTIKISKPRSFQMKMVGQGMEIHIGPVYPMFTAQKELVASPSAIEILGDIHTEMGDIHTCPDNAKLYSDYSDAVKMWYNEILSERSGITLAKPSDIANLTKK